MPKYQVIESLCRLVTSMGKVLLYLIFSITYVFAQSPFAKVVDLKFADLKTQANPGESVLLKMTALGKNNRFLPVKKIEFKVLEGDAVLEQKSVITSINGKAEVQLKFGSAENQVVTVLFFTNNSSLRKKIDFHIGKLEAKECVTGAVGLPEVDVPIDIIKVVAPKPDIDVYSSKVAYVKVKDGEYKTIVTLVDSKGDTVLNPLGVDLKLEGYGAFIKKHTLPEIDESGNFSFKMFPEKIKGTANFRLKIDGKLLGSRMQFFEWNEITYDESKTKVSLSQNKFINTGLGKAEISVEIFDSVGKVLGPKDGYNISFSIDGVGSLGKLSFNDGKTIKEYLAGNIAGTGNITIILNKKTLKTFKVEIKELKIQKDKRDNIRAKYDQHSVPFSNVVLSSDRNEKDIITKIEITNKGPNNISKGSWHREYRMESPEGARQTMRLAVNDFEYQSENISGTDMLSSFYFFPRTTMPKVEDIDEKSYRMILPTGEEVIFEKGSNKIIGGVLEEGPIEIGTIAGRNVRPFTNLKYKGKHIALRMNARAQTPEISQYRSDKIRGDDGTHGAVGALFSKYDPISKKNKTCFVKKSDVVTVYYNEGEAKVPNNAITGLFNFETDQKLKEFLAKKCPNLSMD